MEPMSSGNSINDISGSSAPSGGGTTIADSKAGRAYVFIYDTTKSAGASKKYILPIPKGYSDTFENTWNNVDLGAILGNSLSALKGESTAISGIAGAATGLGNKILDTFAQNIGLSEAKGAVENAVSINARANLNPFTQLMYKSPTLRQFQFTWTLKPKNAKQAFLIRQFVNHVRLASHPGFASIQGVELGGFFSYPSEFQVQIYGGSNKKLVDMISAVCTNLQVQYDTEGNVYTHSDGQPVTTTITISLQETALLNRNIIQDLYPI